MIHFGRGGVIRTHDPLRPRQVRYQAALRPDICCFIDFKLLVEKTVQRYATTLIFPVAKS